MMTQVKKLGGSFIIEESTSSRGNEGFWRDSHMFHVLLSWIYINMGDVQLSADGSHL
jgi:hypothetical protein